MGKKGWKEQKHHAWKGHNDVKHYKGWKSDEKKGHHDLDAKSKHKSRRRKYEVSLPPSLDSNFNLASGKLSRSMQSETLAPLGTYVWKGLGSSDKSKISSRKHGTKSSENSKRSSHATKTISTYVRPENTRTSTRRCGPSSKSEASSSGLDLKLLDSSRGNVHILHS